jgi:hypothetical protein
MSHPDEEIPSREAIEERAYEIYVQRGCQDGQEVADWIAAENELIELAQTGTKAKSASGGR